MMILTYILHLPQVDVANEAFRAICYQKYHHPDGVSHPVLGGSSTVLKSRAGDITNCSMTAMV